MPSGMLANARHILEDGDAHQRQIIQRLAANLHGNLL